MHTGGPLGRRAKLTGTRVLVVEDEIFASMLVEDELRDAGATVLGPAPSVGDALRLVEAAAADGGISAAVLDINLDGRHVAPVADRLAALGVPFVFATGYGENHDTGGHGTAPTLPKPIWLRKADRRRRALACRPSRAWTNRAVRQRTSTVFPVHAVERVILLVPWPCPRGGAAGGALMTRWPPRCRWAGRTRWKRR